MKRDLWPADFTMTFSERRLEKRAPPKRGKPKPEVGQVARLSRILLWLTCDRTADDMGAKTAAAFGPQAAVKAREWWAERTSTAKRSLHFLVGPDTQPEVLTCFGHMADAMERMLHLAGGQDSLQQTGGTAWP